MAERNEDRKEENEKDFEELIDINKNNNKNVGPSKSLLVSNLIRPFTSNLLKELLSKTGNVIRFWLDHIKSLCYVEYSTLEESAQTKEILNDTIWPEGGKRIKVEFVHEDVYDILVEKEREKEKLNIQKTKIIPTNTNSNYININKGLSPDRNKNKQEEPVKTLDTLFRKTKTLPHIYFLPLNEEEVQEKLNKIKNNK